MKKTDGVGRTSLKKISTVTKVEPIGHALFLTKFNGFDSSVC